MEKLKVIICSVDVTEHVKDLSFEYGRVLVEYASGKRVSYNRKDVKLIDESCNDVTRPISIKQEETVTVEIIDLHEAKEYTDKHNTDRNEWVGGAIDMVQAGTHAITYKNNDRYKCIVDREYVQSEMQGMREFDAVLSKALDTLDVAPLLELERKQAMLIIGELADDFEIGE